jgi:hypothetical protein
MNTGSRQNLNWFFNNWFFTNHYIDLRIDSVTKQNNSYAISVTNVGGFAIPFDLRIVYVDGKTSSIHITPGVWRNDKEQVFKVASRKPIKAIHLDGGVFMDYTPDDNFWRE